jgi:hypothetical protein
MGVSLKNRKSVSMNVRDRIFLFSSSYGVRQVSCKGQLGEVSGKAGQSKRSPTSRGPCGAGGGRREDLRGWALQPEDISVDHSI